MSKEHRLPATPDTVHTGVWDNSRKPVLAIDSGDVVSIETMALNDNQLQPGLTIDEILRIRKPYGDRGISNQTLTGPIYVNGAEPGDVLEVQIIKLVPYPRGVNLINPGSMGSGTLPEDFPEGRAWGFRWSEDDRAIDFGHGVRVPIRPFLGVMGVAPEASGPIRTTAPGPYGGNMDLKELVDGATLFLPVFVKGALFSTGDAHAAQGDGEVTFTAIETAMKDARLRFVVRKDLHLKRPMAETPTHWITLGFHEDLDEAAKIALRDAIDWLAASKGLSREEAYSLASLALDLRVTQTVNGKKGIHVMIPKGIFPGSI